MQSDRAQTLLAAWQAGFVSSADIVAWADAQILKTNDSSDLPAWLLDLSQDGPETSVMRPESEFLPRRFFGFAELFACRVARLDIADDQVVLDFAC